LHRIASECQLDLRPVLGRRQELLAEVGRAQRTLAAVAEPQADIVEEQAKGYDASRWLADWAAGGGGRPGQGQAQDREGLL
jgi:hypothetical protein